MSDEHPPCNDEVELYDPPSAEAVPAELGGMELLWRTCKRITNPRNSLVPNELRGRPEAALQAILMGRELGLGDMQALTRIHVINGRPTLAAELVLGLVRRAGHSVVFEERSAQRCIVTGKRADNGDVLTVEWNLDHARAAGLVKKGGAWEQYPRAMLHARAVTELARALFSDTIGWAVYAPEDFDEHRE